VGKVTVEKSTEPELRASFLGCPFKLSLHIYLTYLDIVSKEMF
jgi:hypothetical protein